MNRIFDGPEDAARRLILAHGAGAGMDTPFMNHIAAGVGAAGIRVIRFEFPYMVRRREDGKKRPPDREVVLLDTWRSLIDEYGPDVAIGGKSMGGRMASLIADECSASALICLGYPFHPPGKPEKLRTEHLAGLETRTLVLQGERDTMGAREEVPNYTLADTIQVHWLADGDHSLKPRKKSGRSETENLDEAVSHIVAFVNA